MHEEPFVSRDMVKAGLDVRRDPRMKWKTDEDRLIAEFRAMLAVQEAEKANDRDHR